MPKNPDPTSDQQTDNGAAQRARRVRWIDRLASRVIRFGGGMVIITVLAIFIFIGKEAVPLFMSAETALKSVTNRPLIGMENTSPVLMGCDEYETYAYGLSATGAVHLWSLEDWSPHKVLGFRQWDGRELTTARRSPSRDHLYLGTSDGHLYLAQVKFRPVYKESGRSIETRLSGETLIPISEEGQAIIQVAGRHDEEGTAHFAALTVEGNLYAGTMPEGERPRVHPIGGLPEGEITGLAIDAQSTKLLAATRDGKLLVWYLDHSTEAPFQTIEVGNHDHYITSMDFLIGEISLILGYSDGTMEQWFGVQEGGEGMNRPLQKIRSFETLPGPVVRIEPSGRDKGFLAAAEDGFVRLYFATSQRTIAELSLEGSIGALTYAPKLTGILGTTRAGHAAYWGLDNPHPEISLTTLFSKVWYEGYEKPGYIWQSTGGSDEFEPKLSLTPLILGTLKGGLFGLIFAIPIAVLAAIYTAQFMNPSLKAVVKPAVEIMAALPSVVIGFMAGLWLAPLLENHVLSLVCMAGIIPVLVMAGVIGWHQLPQSLRARFPVWMEMVAISTLVVAGFALAVQLGPWIETAFFGGNLRQWIFDTTGHPYEQRNSIVIGIAMGFAVIPIIYTISDDALTNVPQHFVSGSLALGASRWQTAIRIILPTASPGIFSAVMVGFGRAVGETMIVLMATGNTPILSFSPFNGMRTMSANIAVEIPEAPVAGTLYRVLFLTAILLFVLTFAMNTVAEVVRQRLRDKYKAI